MNTMIYLWNQMLKLCEEPISQRQLLPIRCGHDAKNNKLHEVNIVGLGIGERSIVLQFKAVQLVTQKNVIQNFFRLTFSGCISSNESCPTSMSDIFPWRASKHIFRGILTYVMRLSRVFIRVFFVVVSFFSTSGGASSSTKQNNWTKCHYIKTFHLAFLFSFCF